MAYNSDLVSSASPPSFFKSIRTRLIVYFSLLFATVLVLIGLINMFGIPYTAYNGRQGQQKEEAFRSLNLIADLMEERLLCWIGERRADAHLIADNRLIRNNVHQLPEIANKYFAAHASNPDLASFQKEKIYRDLLDFFKAVKSSHKAYDTIYLADAQTGAILVSTDETDLGKNIRYQPFFTGVLESGYVFISDIDINPRRQRPSLNLSHTIVDEEKKVMAVLVFEIDTDDILLPILHPGQGLGDKGEALLVNRDVIILNPLKHPLADGSWARPLHYQLTTHAAVWAANGGRGITEALDYRREPVLAAYRHLNIASIGGWGLVVKRDRAEVLAPLRQDILSIGVIGAVGLPAVLGLTIVMATNLTRPLRSLSWAAGRVAAGELGVRAAATTLDEVGCLAVTFNSMVQRIQNWHGELEAEVQARTAELDQANKDLRQEIVERKLADLALRESEKRFRLVVQNMPILINAYDQDGLLAFWNRECERVTAYLADEVLGNPHALARLYPDPAYLEQLMAEWANAFRDWELVLTGKDGAPKTIAWSNISNECPVPGWFTWTVGVDITGRKQVEEALAQSRHRYQLLFESMLDGY
ncbi:MAG: cache domain-containing protein, partial [Chloroflexota bacterium]